MSENVLVLMCGGRQTRMGAYHKPKQLIPVCGTPVAERTVMLVRSILNDVEVRVVAPNTPDWESFCWSIGASRADSTDKLFVKALRDVFPDGAYARYLVLCGDVVFSPEMLRDMIHGSPNVRFGTRFAPNLHTGRPGGEIFGFVIEDLAQFRSALDDVLAQIDKISEAVGQVYPDCVDDIEEKNGRLWTLLHALEDGDDATVIECDWADYIDDIDGPDDLERLPRIEAAIRAQERLTK